MKEDGTTSVHGPANPGGKGLGFALDHPCVLERVRDHAVTIRKYDKVRNGKKANSLDFSAESGKNIILPAVVIYGDYSKAPSCDTE